MSPLGIYIRVLVSVFFTALLFVLSVFPIQCFDIFSYLTFGHQWFQSMSYNATIIDANYLESINIKHEWLSYSIFYNAFKFWGFKGVIVLKAVAVCLVGVVTSLFFWDRIFCFVMYQFLYSCSIIFSIYRILSRSSLFSDLFLLLFLMLIALFFSGRLSFIKALFYFGFLMLVWANLHPGFLIAIFIIWGIYFGIKFVYKTDLFMLEIKDYIFKIACLMTAVSFVHPLGIYSWRYTINFVIYKLPFFRVYIKEWAPGVVFLDNVYQFVFIGVGLFSCISLFLLYQLYRNRYTLPQRIRVLGVVFLGLFLMYLGLSFLSVRFFISWFLLQPFIIVYILMRLARYNPKYQRFLKIDYQLFIFFCLFCICVSYFRINTFFIDNRRFGFGLDDRVLPVEFVMNHPKLDRPNLFSIHAYGGFFSFIYYGQKMFINGFVTEKSLFESYFNVIEYKSDKIVNDFFDNYDINTVVLPLRDLKLFNYLDKSPNWKKFYTDKVVVGYHRVAN